MTKNQKIDLISFIATCLITLVMIQAILMVHPEDKTVFSHSTPLIVSAPHTFDPCELESVNCGKETSFQAVITAYSEIDSCHYKNCPMANGIRAAKGYIACPRSYTFGTDVIIEGLGQFTCGDRTALYLDGRFDIFMGYGESALEEAWQFGKQVRKVTIISE